MRRIILTGMPEFVKLIWELELGEIVVAGTIGVIVAVTGIIFLWKLINRRYNGLSREHEWLDSSLQNKSDKLADICNDTNKRIYGFIKTQEAIRQTENRAREANVDLNQFMQSASAVFTQNANFAIEKQSLENKIVSMRKEWNSEKQALEDKISKLKKDLKVAQKQNKQSYGDR